jgi:thiamine pyrophosphate-dependent acetolactate synthase large subunit-like protein
MPTVHQATWGLLRALGVRKVFGNPGSTEMPFLADFPEDVDYVLALHEGAVVGMADAYAQLTGEPTLVNLRTAVGLGNAMGAIINAARGHSPLVITAGQQVRATLTMEPLLANPDPTTLPRPAVLAVSGDGGAQYGIQGLYTAANHRLPVTFLILVNREYGILKGFGDYLTTTGVPGLDLNYLDYQALAKGYGIPAVQTGRPDEWPSR